MLINGRFETNSLSSWIRTEVYGLGRRSHDQIKNMSSYI
jgi:hypothetical protein